MDDNESFNNRLKDVFGGLDSLEKRHSEVVASFANEDKRGEKEKEEKAEEDEMEDDEMNGRSTKSVSTSITTTTTTTSNRKLEQRDEKKRRTTKKLSECDLRNKLNKNKPNNTPDFVVNPAKWKKYSLKDDGSLPMAKGRSADEVNTAVAMQFLQQVKVQKQLSDNQNHSDANGNANGSRGKDESCNEGHVFQIPSLPICKTSSQTQNKQQQQQQQQQQGDESTTTTTTRTTLIRASSHSSKARCMETFEFGGGHKSKTKRIVPATSSIITSDGEGSTTTTNVVLGHCSEANIVDEIDGNDNGHINLDHVHDSADMDNETSVKFKSRNKNRNRSIRKHTSPVDNEEDE